MTVSFTELLFLCLRNVISQKNALQGQGKTKVGVSKDCFF